MLVMMLLVLVSLLGMYAIVLKSDTGFLNKEVVRLKRNQWPSYESATLVDRFAQSVAPTFLRNAGLNADSLQMDFDSVAEGSYRFALALLKASGRK